MMNLLPFQQMAICLAYVLNASVNLETENRANCTKDGLFGQLFFCSRGQGRSPLPRLVSGSPWPFFLPSPEVTSLPPAVWAIWRHLLDDSHPATKLALLFPWTRSYRMAGRKSLAARCFSLGQNPQDTGAAIPSSKNKVSQHGYMHTATLHGSIFSFQHCEVDQDGWLSCSSGQESKAQRREEICQQPHFLPLSLSLSQLFIQK